ncbi:similar to Saccharomyces cerevisiae YHR100C GEP4 Mitochondrial phosphatidylglycerophosphatase (PGP phosphatase) [Maudiozyma saulgeensis]|uniref:Similar to Saccharomyces cerevisiae YHR100C GEP4 Mitochondrial phosphatidylglycerophosphatase (PGP phosphatase) n=1 Tax=Maudiozyma saulgeensis TaxID=1789683 RepID=A0A1X7QXN3_9SACH|nr:similar to Saccharomyces cerevisiae YHR100C GEP4 Mitochondrial phosphatidylglycerophosphatase (PGP phosphatase) [Kazachstania saulgeensis]
MNLSGTLNAFRILYNPSLCKPGLIIDTFNHLPVPINKHIKAVVVDKDNCFAFPKENKVWCEYENKWELLKKSYPGRALLIVSNSAGSNEDLDNKQAKFIEDSLGVYVLRHSTKKPGCHDDIVEYFSHHNIIQDPSEIAVVGDRLFTDIMMANIMNSYGVWVKDGVVKSNNILSRLEKLIFSPKE